MSDQLPAQEESSKSKSQLKREMIALKELGERLLDLSDEQLRTLSIDEQLKEAVIQATPSQQGEVRQDRKPEVRGDHEAQPSSNQPAQQHASGLTGVSASEQMDELPQQPGCREHRQVVWILERSRKQYHRDRSS